MRERSRACGDREAGGKHSVVRVGRGDGTGRSGSERRVVHRRRTGRERIFEERRDDRKQVRARPVQRGGGREAVPDRRRGEGDGGWEHRVHGEIGRSGKDPGASDRVGRGGERVGGASGSEAGGGGGERGRGKREAASGVRGGRRGELRRGKRVPEAATARVHDTWSGGGDGEDASDGEWEAR